MAIIPPSGRAAIEEWLLSYRSIGDMIRHEKDPRKEITDDTFYPTDPNRGLRGLNHISKPTETEAIRSVSDARIQELEAWKELIEELHMWAKNNYLAPVFEYLYIAGGNDPEPWTGLHMSRRTFYSHRERIIIKAYIMAVEAGLLSSEDE